MTDEISKECRDPLRTPKPEGCEHYTDVWQSFAAAKSPERWPITYDALLANEEFYDKGVDFPPFGLFIPDGLSGSDASFAARDVIATQQCSSCHGAETNNDFTHVGKKSQDRKGYELSCFLRGNVKSKTMKPSFKALKELDPTVLCEVQVLFKGPVAANFPDGIAPEPDKPGIYRETRYFHDLARRGLWLAAAMLQPSASATAGRVQDFEKLCQDWMLAFGTAFRH